MSRSPVPASVDVIVVGGGAAGGAAFVEAAAAGASVIGVDVQPAFGGTAALAGGGCLLPGTPLQRQRGIRDSPELALRDVLAAGEGEADEAWARFYLEHAVAEVHDWLVAQGVEFMDLRPQEDNSVPRWHLPRGNGRGVMDALWTTIEGRGLADRWRWSTRLVDLLVGDGTVVGVRVRNAAGAEQDLRGAAVVVATGGFAGDLERVLANVPALRAAERVLVGGGPSALGLGHDVLVRHGAVVSHLHNLWTYAYATPDYRDPSGLRGLAVRGIEAGIWVNAHGRRFHDESRNGPTTATPALLAQPGQTCWAILDRPAALGMRVADPSFRLEAGAAAGPIEELLRSSGHAWSADDPAALGRAAGVDPDALAETIRTWNRLVTSGVPRDPATGRPLAGLRPLVDGPLYALQFFPLARKNLGGVHTDLRCRVVDAAGDPIPGLYAAGELTGFGGGHLSGRHALEGIMIGSSLFGGRVAGAWAAHHAGAPRPSRFEAEAVAG